jgi:hypothetical protein
MLDRQKVETILERRFPGARHDQLAAAANAIMGLNEEWEEISILDAELDRRTRCHSDCVLARETALGHQVRLLRRRDH